MQHPKGMPANPMNDSEVEQKFHDLVDGLVGAEGADEIIAAVGRLSGETTASDLVAVINHSTGAPIASGSL